MRRNRQLNTDVFARYRGEGIIGAISGSGKGPRSERHLLAHEDFCLGVIQGHDTGSREQIGIFHICQRGYHRAEGDAVQIDFGRRNGWLVDRAQAAQDVLI